MNTPAEPSRPAAFHGWKILGLGTFSQFVSIGFTVYLIGLLIEPLSKAFNVTPGTIGSGAAIFYLVNAAIGPVLGYWVDKGKVRIVLTAGAVMLAIGLVLFSQSTALWQVALLCLLLVGPGAGMVGVVPATAMVIRWFNRRRGFALGLAAAGMSLGGFMMPPIAAGLIENFGWRSSLFMLGITVAVLLVPAAWFITVSNPEEKGQYPDGDSKPPEVQAGAQGGFDQGFKELVLQRNFWLLCVSVGLLSFASTMMITYLAPYASERGTALQMSALVLSAYPGAGFCGKFLFGWLTDRFFARHIMLVLIVGMALGMLPMILLDGVAPLVVSAILCGLAIGGLVPVWAALIAIYFGPAAFGRVKGSMSLVMLAAVVLPGPLGGFFRDTYGSYSSAFLLVWCGLPIAVLATLMIRRKTDPAKVDEVAAAV